MNENDKIMVVVLAKSLKDMTLSMKGSPLQHEYIGKATSEIISLVEKK